MGSAELGDFANRYIPNHDLFPQVSTIKLTMPSRIDVGAGSCTWSDFVIGSGSGTKWPPAEFLALALWGALALSLWWALAYDP